MTHVTVIKKGEHITEVVCSGHTNYGVAGEDIVCAALSSVVQTAVLGLFQVAGVNLSVERDEKRGYLRFVLPDGLSDKVQEKADVITGTMLLGVADLNEGFSDFIELEVKKQ